MENLTEIQDNPFRDTDLDDQIIDNSGMDPSWTPRVVFSLIMHIIKFLLCLMNISASIFLMVVIIRFRKLRTRVNLYFFHYALNNAMFYLCEPIFYMPFSFMELTYNKNFLCCLNQLDDSCLVLLFVFALFASLDYYSCHLGNRLLFFYKNMFSYFIFVLYNVGIIKFLISIIICFSDQIHLRHHVSIATYAIIFIIITVMNIIEYKQRRMGNKQERIRYALVVADIIIYCWFPLFLYSMFGRHIFYELSWDEPVRWFLMFVFFVPEFLAHGHGIIVVYMLGRLDKNFKMAYTIALKRRFRNYEHNDLDQSEEESTVHHQVNGYNKNTNENEEVVDTEEAYSDVALR